jgi:hypothetical protein
MARNPFAGAESLFALREVSRETEIPWDLPAMTKSSPQAILRDLHRPVTRFKVLPQEFDELPMLKSRAGTAETKELRALALASYRVPIVELLHTTNDMLNEFRKLKATIALPWTDAPKMKATSKEKFEASLYFR